ncbi:MAG: HNH endonuclease, partial [Bifidobacteriaceae bacterium]|nr:HNH endonuclease [Bifidobacteriaceae bacterium]
PAGNRGAGSGRAAGPSVLAGAEPGGPVDAEAGASGVFGARLGWGGDAVDSRAFARLACDCEAVRVVLGARSQVLDVGRATRVIPAGLRIALAARDKGCCFPGCDRPPEVCEGHHVLPWQRGGTTCLSNICLLCPAHHRLVEPPRNGPPGWQARLREDGLWEFVPPAQFDPERKPILHQRFQQPGPSR